MDINSKSNKVVIIIGAGLVGSVASCLLAKRGYQVKLFEMRPDIRSVHDYKAQSINLAISERGQSALRLLDLEDSMIHNYAIPMKGRMIHDLNLATRVIPYGKSHQCIYSISRRCLSEKLLFKMDSYDNIHVYFQHKLISCNLEKGQIQVVDSQGMVQTIDQCHLIIGCDGTFSQVRRQIMSLFRFDFSQKYIDHGYIEFKIEPAKDGSFAMPPNYLHIWPRGKFMLIALPNKNKTFTVTLFMPFSQYESIQSSSDCIAFFEANFYDALTLIGRKNVTETFLATKPKNLVSIKCHPYNYKNKVLLMGDAAHAMVPFYGQGMNCGLEDCFILDQLLEKYDLSEAVQMFGTQRSQDAHVICDLALSNYIEMRDLVNSKKFIFRKKVDTLLSSLLPRHWIPLYTLVTFTQLSYSECVKYRKIQDNIIFSFICLTILTVFLNFLYFVSQ